MKTEQKIKLTAALPHMPRQITDTDRAAVAQNIRHTKIVEAGRKLARIVKHVDPDAKTKTARTRLEKDLPRWLRYHGGEAFSAPWSPDHGRVLAKIATAMNKGGLFALAMPRGHGKALDLDTPIPTPTGWKTMDELRPGDAVFDDCGKPCFVVAKSAIWRDRPVYRVSINRENAPILADANHLWPVEFDRRRKPKTRTTLEIAHPRETRASLKVAPALDLPEAKLPIDPYLMGVWLGDGHSQAARITTEDSEVADYLATYAESNGMRVRVYCNGSRAKTYALSSSTHGDPTHQSRHTDGRRGTYNLFIDALRRLGVFGNKHIPDIYLRASASQRLALLQGLVDTDGYVAEDGQTEFCNTSRALSFGVLELVRTLGVRAFLSEGRAKIYGRDCGPKYRVTFYMSDSARLPRKRERCRSSGTMIRHSIDAKPYGVADTVCIQVSSASGCFLAGRAMVPTHNSTILKWVTAYVLLTGRRKYVVVIAATAEMAQAIVDFIRQQITESDTLHAHYPQVTSYARATDGKAIKARYQLRADGKASGILWSKTTLVFPEVVSPEGKPYASNGAILEAHGLTGAIRGKWKDTKTGKVLRPDFVILDDPQDRSSAESPTQCAMRERIITGDVLGLAGPKKRIAAVMPCTIIRKGDLADRFLDHKQHPEWQGEVCRLVNTWPTAQDTLWKEYERIYREETSEGRGFGLATEFYKSNRTEMDSGANVSWEHRVRDSEVSALQTAENLRIESGPQFWAEYQNEPLDIVDVSYRLKPENIIEKIGVWPRFAVPDSATILVAATDINRARGGLHWVVVAFDQKMSASVVVYGRWPESGEVWPENAPVGDRQRKLFGELTRLGQHILALPLIQSGVRIKPARLLIDRGYEPDVVGRFCAQGGFPFALIPCRGYAAHVYRPRKDMLVGAPRENCHVTEAPDRIRAHRYVAFNADAVREQMQRAWMGVAGEPGGAVLYKSEPRQHVTFADHLSAEILRQKYETDYGWRFEWTHQPGAQWDWADAMSMAYVAALEQGWTAQGIRVANRPRRETRKCSVEQKL